MFDERSPIYRQIADQIMDDIVRGTLEEEDQIMSTNQYAAYYRINPATAAKAFQQLVDEDVLYKKRGIGMFVAPGARDRLLAARRDRFFAEVLGPMLSEARAIGIPVSEILERIQREDRESGHDRGASRTEGAQQ